MTRFVEIFKGNCFLRTFSTQNVKITLNSFKKCAESPDGWIVGQQWNIIQKVGSIITKYVMRGP